jgi:hypothetical protein
VLWDSANHLQTVLGLVSLRRSEGDEGQRYSRAEGKGTADDNEKHDTYKSISDAAGPPKIGFFEARYGAIPLAKRLKPRDLRSRSNLIAVARLNER